MGVIWVIFHTPISLSQFNNYSSFNSRSFTNTMFLVVLKHISCLFCLPCFTTPSVNIIDCIQFHHQSFVHLLLSISSFPVSFISSHLFHLLLSISSTTASFNSRCHSHLPSLVSIADHVCFYRWKVFPKIASCCPFEWCHFFRRPSDQSGEKWVIREPINADILWLASEEMKSDCTAYFNVKRKSVLIIAAAFFNSNQFVSQQIL